MFVMVLVAVLVMCVMVDVCKVINKNTYTQFQSVNLVSLLIPLNTLATLQEPANIYLFKVRNRNTKKRDKIRSKLTIKTPERHH